MKSGSAPTVFMIALDACEPKLLEAWMDDGALPALAAVRKRGAYGRLSSTASILATSAWPSFLSGTPPEVHGGYHYLQWRPKEMRMRRWHRDWIDVEPFWRELARRGVPSSAIDVPWVDQPRDPIGVELSGFACLPRIFEEHATVDPARYVPRGDLAGLGSQLVGETGAPTTLGRLRAIVEAYIEGGRRMTEVACGVMQEMPAGFSIVALSAAHIAGHLSWSEDGVNEASGQDTRRQLKEILRGAYSAVDRAVGRLVEAADRETLLMIFSVNGMDMNTSRNPVLSQMLGLVLTEGKARPARGRSRLLDLRNAIPISWRSALKHRLPIQIQDGLHLFWRGFSQDPSGRRAFAVESASEGLVRINLKGREARGVVEPGTEYEELCAQISVGLAAFEDSDTGEALVRRVDRIDRLLPDGVRRSDLPDLIVRWSASPAARHRRIVSAEFGGVDWPTPGKMPDGRSGNHSDRGFLIACGPGIVAGSEVSGAHILDLPPTVFAALGEQPPSRMKGQVLDQLLGRSSEEI